MPSNSCNQKVKNPCKICLTHVSTRNGLQCQGACKKWAHYKCLNFTPGKISDIKAGIIKVMCPCPNCDTNHPKEYLTNPPYICSNHQCPVNKIPVCQSKECPTVLSRQLSATSTCPTDQNQQQSPCNYAMQSKPPLRQRPSSLSRPPYPSSMQSPCPPPPRMQPQSSRHQQGNRGNLTCCSNHNQRQSQQDSSAGKPCQNLRPQQDYSAYNLTSPVKSPSCSFQSPNEGAKYLGRIASSSESEVARNRYDPMVSTLEDMFNTMTKLTVQMKDLMAKMVSA